jgi:hypothetical protein
MQNKTIREILLVCGILSSLCYLGTDILAGSLWHGYSFMDQAFSDYSAIQAPTRLVILLTTPIYCALVIAFGLGILWSAGQKRSQRFIGFLLTIYAVADFVWPLYFPVDFSGTTSTFTNAMHIVLTVVTVVSWILILGFGAIAFGRRFRLYSILTIVIVILFGSLAGYVAGTESTAVSQSAPWFGVMERINIYSFMLWAVVLAVLLLRADELFKQQECGGQTIQT